jgi:chemotaxis methyl-accepting protein methylase
VSSAVQKKRAPLAGPFMRANERVWKRIPVSLKSTRLVRRYGAFLHSLAKQHIARGQLHGTFFLRNRAELELIGVIANQSPKGATLRIGVVACSNGAEVYSIAWTIRSARPDLNLVIHAVDIARDIVEIAKEGAYPLEKQDLIGAPIFERLSVKEIEEIFDQGDGQMNVRPWIKEGIEWHAGDAADPAIARQLGQLDIVVANNFLCHMNPPDADQCLRRVAQLVKPGGYIFVSGVDLEVRTKVALELQWHPVTKLLEEIHDGDPSVRNDWPWRYWGLEPIDRRIPNWAIRYAAVFQLGESGGTGPLNSELTDSNALAAPSSISV